MFYIFSAVTGYCGLRKGETRRRETAAGGRSKIALTVPTNRERQKTWMYWSFWKCRQPNKKSLMVFSIFFWNCFENHYRFSSKNTDTKVSWHCLFLWYNKQNQKNERLKIVHGRYRFLECPPTNVTTVWFVTLRVSVVKPARKFNIFWSAESPTQCNGRTARDSSFYRSMPKGPIS